MICPATNLHFDRGSSNLIYMVTPPWRNPEKSRWSWESPRLPAEDTRRVRSVRNARNGRWWAKLPWAKMKHAPKISQPNDIHTSYIYNIGLSHHACICIHIYIRIYWNIDYVYIQYIHITISFNIIISNHSHYLTLTLLVASQGRCRSCCRTKWVLPNCWGQR